ncbi:unnamed protein product, partial [Oikopleura dioica]
MEENNLEIENEESQKAKQLENVQSVEGKGQNQISDQLVQELQEKALQDGMESADASARQSRIEKEEDEESEEESGSEISYSRASSESDSEASQRDAKSPSREEQLLKNTLSEALPHHVIPTLVGAALDDGLISAQRSAAESRAESARPTFVENEVKKSAASSRRDSISSDSSNASDASTVISVDETFTPPKDPAGYKSSWTTTGQLKCVFELNLPNRFSEVEIADDLLEQALSNHDESLSPVLSFQKPETDYSLLIPFELLYRSNTRHIRARGSRDGINWIDLPADGRFIDGFEENFAKIATRRCKYVTLSLILFFI